MDLTTMTRNGRFKTTAFICLKFLCMFKAHKPTSYECLMRTVCFHVNEGIAASAPRAGIIDGVISAQVQNTTDKTPP